MKKLLGIASALLLLSRSALAATVTHEVTYNNTENVAVYTTGAFTPADGDLLVVQGRIVGTTSVGTCTTSAGTTFTKLDNFGSTTVFNYIANSFSTATSQTVSIDVTGDNGTGGIIFVMSVTGMSRTGSSAVRTGQYVGPTGAGGGTPEAIFPGAALTENPTIAVANNTTNPAALTPPSGWAENADVGFATPTTGGEYATRDSGFTGTTITWGSTSATTWRAVALELDTSAAPAGCGTTLLLMGAGCQ